MGRILKRPHPTFLVVLLFLIVLAYIFYIDIIAKILGRTQSNLLTSVVLVFVGFGLNEVRHYRVMYYQNLDACCLVAFSLFKCSISLGRATYIAKETAHQFIPEADLDRVNKLLAEATNNAKEAAKYALHNFSAINSMLSTLIYMLEDADEELSNGAEKEFTESKLLRAVEFSKSIFNELEQIR